MKVYIDPSGGMCNRIMAINATEQLCRELGCEYSVIWRNNGECACDYEDIFEPGDAEVTNIRLPRGRIRQSIEISGLIQALKNRVQYQRYTGRIRKFRKYRFPVNGYPESDESLKRSFEDFAGGKDMIYINTCIQYFGKTEIKKEAFNKEIVMRANERICSIGRYVACHIRRTDNKRSIEKSTTESFISVIEDEIKKDPEIKIYVATDDGVLFSDIKNRFEKSIIDADDIERSRRTLKGMKDAVYELLILSGAERLYGSRWSTYTDIAKILHGSK